VSRINCRELIEFLDRYIDGELPASMTAKFEEHLALCAACVDYLHSYRGKIRLAGEAWRDAEIAIEDVPSGLIAATVAVDSAGNVIQLSRMDWAQVASIEVGIGKVRAAAILRRPIPVFEEQVRNGVAALALAGATPCRAVCRS